ncbi:MAG: hypothetical protein AAF401_03350 [Pseudomonadota bacterium]
MPSITRGLTASALALSVVSGASGATLIGSEFNGQNFFEIDVTEGSATVLQLQRQFGKGLAYYPNTNGLVVRRLNSGIEFIKFNLGLTPAVLQDGSLTTRHSAGSLRRSDDFLGTFGVMTFYRRSLAA